MRPRDARPNLYGAGASLSCSRCSMRPIRSLVRSRRSFVSAWSMTKLAILRSNLVMRCFRSLNSWVC